MPKRPRTRLVAQMKGLRHDHRHPVNRDNNGPARSLGHAYFAKTAMRRRHRYGGLHGKGGLGVPEVNPRVGRDDQQGAPRVQNEIIREVAVQHAVQAVRGR